MFKGFRLALGAAAAATGNRRMKEAMTLSRAYSKNRSFSPLVFPSTLDRSLDTWGLWERESLAIPKFIYRDVARDLLHTAIFRLRNNMVKCCPVKNTSCEDLFDILLNCDTEEDLIKGVKSVLKKLFPDCKGANRETYEHFIKAVDKIKNWQQMVFLLHHVFLMSLRERTVHICTSVQIYKNFDKDFRNQTLYPHDNWMTIYNDIATATPTRRLTIYDGQMIKDQHMRKAVDGVYNRSSRTYGRNGRAGSALLFRNSIEHLNEHLGLKDCVEREKAMVILHSVLGGVSLDVFDNNTCTKTGNKIILNVSGTVRNYGVL